MPAAVKYPGTYIQELPSSAGAITGVATSITAFVGAAARGPVNQPTTIQSFAEYERTFGGSSPKSTMTMAVQDFYANGGSDAVIVRLTRPDAASATIALHTNPDDADDATSPALVLQAASPGAWGNHLSALVDAATSNPADTSLFNLTLILRDTSGVSVLASEQYLNSSVDPASSRYVRTLLGHGSSLMLVAMDSATPATAQVPGQRPGATVDAATPPMPRPVTADGKASDGSALTADDFIGPDLLAAKQGLYALEHIDLLNLLVIPPYTSTGDVDVAVVDAAATYAEARRAFYIVDPPSSWTTPAAALTGMQDPGNTIGTKSANAAVYFPRIGEVDPLLAGQTQTLVPSGAIAGIYARTDVQRGVWKAPAGQNAEILGVVQLSVPLTDAQNNQLNAVGLNCLRSFPSRGPVVWGARTLQGADSLSSQNKYISVRRTLLFLEESLSRGTKWVVFEPNGESLWASIRLAVGTFMHGLFARGAFAGSTPDQAYFVKCDAETTTQADVEQGVVNMMVGFAPLRPAEFVVLEIQQIGNATPL